MQINFYMDGQDQSLFHEYLFSHGGYLVPEYWDTSDVPIYTANSTATDSNSLKIFNEAIFPKSSFSEPGWITPHKPTQRFYVHGPGMQYRACLLDSKGLHRGRIYMGLVSVSSFCKPREPDTNARQKYEASYKALEKFYRSCCLYIRNNYRKDAAGFYHGAGSDQVEFNGIAKVQI